jgi:hypothetical protein
VYVNGPEPDHVPGVAVNGSPCCAVPEIVGGELLTGGTAPDTTAVTSDD